MKTGSKYYGFKNWDENRVKHFREKEPENLGMKTWTPTDYTKILYKTMPNFSRLDILQKKSVTFAKYAQKQ